MAWNSMMNGNHCSQIGTAVLFAALCGVVAAPAPAQDPPAPAEGASRERAFGQPGAIGRPL